MLPELTNENSPSLHAFTAVFLQVALVGQEPVLFARSVEENITYGLGDTPMEAVIHTATKANAHDFITDLPKGYQTSNYYRMSCISRPLQRNPVSDHHYGNIYDFPVKYVHNCRQDLFIL